MESHLEVTHRGVNAQPELYRLRTSLDARADLKMKAGTVAATAEEAPDRTQVTTAQKVALRSSLKQLL